MLHHPDVLQGLSPVWGARFMLDHGVAAFLTLGGVVLAVTGAEALYADRGHFGAMPNPPHLVRDRATGGDALLPRDRPR